MQNKDIDISYSVASWTGLFNRKKLTWYVPGLNFIDLKENKLPNLSPYTKTVEGLNAEYSKRWAQLEKVPFFLPVGDGASSNIGVGCNSENKIALSIGTTGALRVLTNKSKINTSEISRTMINAMSLRAIKKEVVNVLPRNTLQLIPKTKLAVF